MAAFLSWTHPAEEEEPAPGVIPVSRTDDATIATEAITDTEGKPGTRWNPLNKTVPKWTYGTTGPRRTPTNGTAGPYRYWPKVNRLLHDTPACNSCISCKITIFACIMRNVKLACIPMKTSCNSYFRKKSRLHFLDDPVFFQPECHTVPVFTLVGLFGIYITDDWWCTHPVMSFHRGMLAFTSKVHLNLNIVTSYISWEAR